MELWLPELITHNGFNVFGIPSPVNGQKYSSATWLGDTNPIWNLGSNWSQGFVPNSNTSVIIKSTATPPVMEGLGPYSSAVLEIESGGSLTQNEGIGYTIGFYCILSGGIFNVNGSLKVNTDLSVGSGGALNINNGGAVVVGPKN